MAAAAGDGGGEGGAGLGSAAGPGPGPGPGLRGQGPLAEAHEGAPDPAPAALPAEEVAARLQRMRRELSNRRKILVKNLPQDSNCQVRGRCWGRRVPGGGGAALRVQAEIGGASERSWGVVGSLGLTELLGFLACRRPAREGGRLGN